MTETVIESASGKGNSTKYLTILSQALLGRNAQTNDGVSSDAFPHNDTEVLARDHSTFGPSDFSELWTLAMSHHVIVRAFPALRQVLRTSGNEISGDETSRLIDATFVKESVRVQHALTFLSPICESLEQAGDVVVIKSLDHWPDLGSDLDLLHECGR